MQVEAIRVLKGALDEIAVEGERRIILRGVIDPFSLQNLRVDDYQREAQPLQSQGSILEALISGEPLPDIELGMRGQSFDSQGDVTKLMDPVYIIDGLQRVTTALYVLNSKGLHPHIGATIHFDTTKAWERQRFHKLNSSRLKVAPSVLLRNQRDESPLVRLLYSFTTATGSPLHNRVQWGQRMTKGELLSALTLVRAVGYLMSHKGSTQTVTMRHLLPAIDRTVATIGPRLMRENVTTFFDLVDQCWGLRRISYREGARHLRSTFLFSLAKVLSEHTDFWQQDDARLVVSADLRRKMKSFPINTDQHLSNLAGSSGKAGEILSLLLVEHLDSGKRTKRLTSRHGRKPIVVDDEEQDAA